MQRYNETATVTTCISKNAYIIAYQIPDESPYIQGWYRLSMSKEKLDSLDRLLDLCLKIHDCYWIVRKADTMVFGPMSKSDFDNKCTELGVKIRLNPDYEMEYYSPNECDTVEFENATQEKIPFSDNADTSLICNRIWQSVFSGCHDLEFFLSKQNEFSSFTCILSANVESNNVICMRINHDDYLKHDISNAKSDSIPSAMGANDILFNITYSEQMEVIEEAISHAQKYFKFDSISSLNFNLAYLGDESINITRSYEAMSSNGGIDKATALTTAIMHSQLYEDLSRIFGKYSICITGVEVGFPSLMKDSVFKSCNRISIDIPSPSEIISTVIHFSLGIKGDAQQTLEQEEQAR